MHAHKLSIILINLVKFLAISQEAAKRLLDLLVLTHACKASLLTKAYDVDVDKCCKDQHKVTNGCVDTSARNKDIQKHQYYSKILKSSKCINALVGCCNLANEHDKIIKEIKKQQVEDKLKQDIDPAHRGNREASRQSS